MSNHMERPVFICMKAIRKKRFICSVPLEQIHEEEIQEMSLLSQFAQFIRKGVSLIN